MKHLELKENIHWIGALDPNLRVFDIIMYTEFGTTYNSYLVEGSEKTAVIETVKIKFWDQYIEKLKSMTDLNKIDYIIVDHTEPDHVGSVERLLEFVPNATVVGSASAIRFLKAIANRDFKHMVVNTGDSISLGDKTLEFISAPFLHWPDSIYTYCPESKVLFTCDSFGSHYSLDDILISKLDNEPNYMKALKYYFDMIMGPFKSHMLNAIEKIEDKDFDMICPGHGPVLDENPRKVVELCREWSTEVNPNESKSIVIPYVSAYGYTEEMAKEIEKGIKDSDPSITVESYDMVTADLSTVMERIHWADGILLGSPTINSDALPPIWNIAMGLNPIVHGRKFAAAFGAYGWSGEAVPNLEARFKQARLRIMPGLKVNFKPNTEELLKAYEFGKDFVEHINGKTPAVATVKKDKKTPSGDGEVKKWRCIICGEIFEGVEPPEPCPACGASAEQFEEWVEVTTDFKSDTEETFVIVGNNAAGTSAAEAIRLRNERAVIKVVSKDQYLAYYRPMLSDFISDSHDENMFFLHDEDWYKERNIDLTLGTEVTKLNPEQKTIETADGQAIEYDKLILANGSYNFVPNITDNNKPGVFTIKSLDDAKAVKDHAKTSEKVVVIGGGLLGLEAAWELKCLGKDVTVLEMMNRLLPRQLDEHGSEVFEAGVKAAGITVVKGVQANAILGHESVAGVQLCDGEIFEADLVIISAGIRANSLLAKEAGLETNRGVIVNENMMTSHKNIFAAGDVCEFEGVNYAIWPEALEQGAVAGANAAGETLTYANLIPSNVFNGMNMNVFSIGDIGRDENTTYKTVIDQGDNGDYKKLFFVKDRFVGGILIGDISKTGKLIRGVQAGTHTKDLIADVLL